VTRLPGIRAIGLDPGSKRIGVAVSDLSGTIASPLVVLQRSKSREHDLRELAALVRDEEAEVVVVGHPINLDGSPSRSSKAAAALAKQLATLVDVPVELHDERLTTVTAERSMMEAGLDGVQRRQRVDKVAAAVMLQSWLDARAHRLGRDDVQGDR
jgi:putative Holliday junction resolvase